MWRKHLEEARKQGEYWAEAKADVLNGNIPAVDWPDVWRREWDGHLDLRRIDERHQHVLVEEAHRAAVEHWGEIVKDQRELEDVEDEERDEEADAVRLFRAVQRDLPQGLIVGQDGPRVYLQDKMTGEEMRVDRKNPVYTVFKCRQQREVKSGRPGPSDAMTYCPKVLWASNFAEFRKKIEQRILRTMYPEFKYVNADNPLTAYAIQYEEGLEEPDEQQDAEKLECILVFY